MRPALAVLALLSAAPAAAQEVLFFRQHNLASVPPFHTDVAAAIAHLCAGPTHAEAPHGHSPWLPAGTHLYPATHRHGVVRLVSDETLLNTAPGGQLEDAIDQIDKTALNAPGASAVQIAIRRADGSEVDLRTAL